MNRYKLHEPRPKIIYPQIGDRVQHNLRTTFKGSIMDITDALYPLMIKWDNLNTVEQWKQDDLIFI